MSRRPMSSFMTAAVLLAVSTGVVTRPSAKAEPWHGGWALFNRELTAADLHAAQATFGGICNIGQTNRVVGHSYPKNVYFAGGARCTSGGQPVDVYQEGKVTLYKGVRDSYLAEGNEIFGLQDWSISSENYGGGDRGLRFTNNLVLRLTTPDGKPWAVIPDQCDRDRPDSVVCYVDKRGQVK